LHTGLLLCEWAQYMLEKKQSAMQRIFARIRLGDKVEAVTGAVGINPCAGCQKRKAILNGEAKSPTSEN
jgi:hypothetical protein